MTTDVSLATRQPRVSRLITDLLRNLDALPHEACVPIQVVAFMTGRSRASIWRDVSAGRLPAPFKTGPKSSRWKLGDIRQAIAAMQGVGK